MTIDKLFESVLDIRNLAELFIEKFRNSEKKIFLFGIGAGGHTYEKYLTRHGIRIEGFIDNYQTELVDMPYPVFKLEDVMKNYKKEDCIILISAPSAREEIYKQLIEVYESSMIFSLDISRYVFVNNEPCNYRRFVLEHESELRSIYEELADNKSKEVMVKMICGYLSSNPDEFKSVRTGEFYHPSDIIKFNKNEVMVELGANNGETLIDFVECCPEFKSAYCFEPDSICLEKLKKAAMPYGERVRIIPKGAWSKNGTIYFTAYGETVGVQKQEFGSYVTEEKTSSSIPLEVASIDEEVSEDMTYMKMDIEGSELEALKGASEHIKKTAPKLAISVYHKSEDILTLPSYLKSLVSDYKFYLRHHGVDDTDTVLYAVKEI